MQECAYSPSGSKIMKEPDLQHWPSLQKPCFLTSFFYRSTFVTRLRRYCLFCPGVPKGCIRHFNELYNFFTNSCYFVSFRSFWCQQVAMRAKQQLLLFDLQNFITFGILYISLLLPLLLEAKSSSCEFCVVSFFHCVL